MKRSLALTLAAWFFLGCITTVHAEDASHCPCPRPAAAMAMAGVINAIPQPQPPVVVEAPTGQLDLHALAGANATVEFTYPEIANGHTVGLYWTSPVRQYRAPVQTVAGGANKVTFSIPNAEVVRDLGQSAVLTASVGVSGEKVVVSQPQTIAVVNNAIPGQYPPPTVPAAPDNNVDIGQLAEAPLIVSVHYPALGLGQAVQVKWQGATSYTSELRIPSDNTPLQVPIPYADVLASLGKQVTLTYEVTVDGRPAEPSDSAMLNISLKSLPTTPIVTAAPQGQLDLLDLRRQNVKITYTYPGITAGQTVGIRWAGDPVYDTPHPVIGATPRPLEFTIPYANVSHENGKSVVITASVGIGDNHVVASPELTLKIIDSRPSGEQVATGLNARYNDTRTACDNNQPSYYCNGVTIRGTDNGNFDPWDPSPTQQRKGSISFSHMRKDSRVTLLARNSGYMLLPQEQAIAQGKQKEYLCSYPHDGWTDIVGRPALGCGLQPKVNQKLIDLLTNNPELVNLLRNDEALLEQLINNQDLPSALRSSPRIAELLKANPDLGPLLRENDNNVEQWSKATTLADVSTCASVNANTLATWYEFSRALSALMYQCSLSAQNTEQFDTSLKARGYSLPAGSTTWNELLIRVWPSGIAAQLPLEAFYYQNAAGLPDAKAYQQKYVTRTGGLWLPVVKLDMTKLAGNPFSYASTDQAVQP
jgi:hypothetical protein